MKLDILALGAHPDDVELGAGGTIIAHIKKGYKCGIVDLTQGELGTRGNAQTRMEESNDASRILGINIRENLKMQDGFFSNDREHQLKIVATIRKYRPEIILSNAVSDRHPDHGRSAALITNAVFLAGLTKIDTTQNGDSQEAWKVKAHYHYIQDRYIKPDLVIDVTDVWEKKMEAIMAFKTQFYIPGSSGPQTAISGKDFIEFLKGRAIEVGRPAGFLYGEAFTVERTIGVDDLLMLK